MHHISVKGDLHRRSSLDFRSSSGLRRLPIRRPWPLHYLLHHRYYNQPEHQQSTRDRHPLSIKQSVKSTRSARRTPRLFSPTAGWPASTYVGFGRHLATGVILSDSIVSRRSSRSAGFGCSISAVVPDLGKRQPSSRLSGNVDTNRLGIAGHSLGGATTMMVASRDARIKAAVALDPVNRPQPVRRGHLGLSNRVPRLPPRWGVWVRRRRRATRTPTIHDLSGRRSHPQAKYVVANASHCDFMDADIHSRRLGVRCSAGYRPVRTGRRSRVRRLRG